ncbi:MAG: tetratricopeptide repeat protein, partial [Neptuniibacter sp.]
MDTQNTSLDSKELMHIALYEAGQNNPSQAINHLKQLLDLEPDNGNARYLLGALHAEIGLHEQAIEEMQQAIDSDPNLPSTAVFQLGLLHLTSGNI